MSDTSTPVFDDAGDTAAPTVPPATPKDGEKYWTKDEVESIRRQEKDKLYSRIEKLQHQVETFNAEREEAKRLAEELAHKEAEERRQREEAEMSAKELLLKREDEFQKQINSVQQEWEQKFSLLQQEAETQKQILEHERRFQELESYKSRRLQEEQDGIMPELLDFIRGNTEEEIESSISAVRDRTSAILENIQQSLPQQQQRPRGIPTTGSTPMGPMENATEQQTFTAQDIASMTIDQYAAVRDRLIKAASMQR